MQRDTQVEAGYWGIMGRLLSHMRSLMMLFNPSSNAAPAHEY
jgi:hypothetical protein